MQRQELFWSIPFLSCVLFDLMDFQFLVLNLLVISLIIVTVNLLYTMTHKPVIYSLNKTQKDILLPLFELIFTGVD
jgi:hypothetical protein